MPDAASLTPDSRFFGLFVGTSGTGKKAAACTFPHPIKYLDFDGRIRGLLGCPWIERKGIDYTYYPPITQGGIFAKLNKDLEAMKIMADNMQLPYKTVILASLTGESLSFLNDAIPLTHAQGKGKVMGGVLNMPGPEDWNYQAVAMQQVLSFFRSMPAINFISTAHIVPRWGKAPGAGQYDANVEIGEKLNLTDKLSASLPAFFDNIFKFSKSVSGPDIKHYCTFRGDLARTTYNKLPNGDVDVTSTDFFKYLSSKIEEPAVATSLTNR